MANIKLLCLYSLLVFIIFSFPCFSELAAGARTTTQLLLPFNNNQKGVISREEERNSKIGSTAPNCTYNECRGCKYRCRAEQVPVEGNDPINSAYHYKCVCHK